MVLTLVGCAPTLDEKTGDTAGDSAATVDTVTDETTDETTSEMPPPPADEICDEMTICPDVKYINCMPVIHPDFAAYCEEPCLSFIRDECGLSVVW